MYKVWCYAIDDHNEPHGGAFSVSADSNSNIGDLKEMVKKAKEPRFNKVAIEELELWKVLKSVSFEETTTALKSEITQLKIPDRETDEESTNDVQRLNPSKKLLYYWDEPPVHGDLHVIARPPAGTLPSPSTSSNSATTKSGYKIPLDQVIATEASQDSKFTYVPPSFVRFWKAAWGNPLSENATQSPSTAKNAMEIDLSGADEDRDVEMALRIDEEPHEEGTAKGEEIDVPSDGDILPGQLVIKGFFVDSPEIVVRANYLRVYDAIDTFYANAKRHKHHKPLAAVVTGQPGIGKSSWIRYAIRRRLGLKLPTVLYRENTYIRFTESGVIKDKSNPSFYKESEEPYWCFIDSDQAPDGIPLKFSDQFRPGIFPIYVTSPIESHWKHLHHSRNYIVFAMNPWTWEEVEHVARTLYPSDMEAQERFYGLSQHHGFVSDTTTRRLPN